MNTPTRPMLRWVVVLLAVAGLPLAGAWLAHHDLSAIFRFPPPPGIPTSYPRWSWYWAGGLVGSCAVFGWAWRRHRPTRPEKVPLPARSPVVRSLPAWGWIALGWTALWWLLAWTRFDWFAGAQLFTFFPLWLGFIVTVNAWVQRRTGRCLMARAPRRWLQLFIVSALFWWVFEWLNRFVRNWHYLGVEEFGATAYALHASLCFSTVLPAVSAIQEWLASFPGFQKCCANGPRWTWFNSRGTSAVLIAGGCLALYLTGVWPEVLYPALWAAPLALVVGTRVLSGRAGWWTGVARGDWQQAGTWAIAALICGGFWEMWNFHSAAKWIYTVPYIERWHVFEMPLLGYLGYLGFGLECCVVVEAVLCRNQATSVDS